MSKNNIGFPDLGRYWVIVNSQIHANEGFPNSVLVKGGRPPFQSLVPPPPATLGVYTTEHFAKQIAAVHDGLLGVVEVDLDTLCGILKNHKELEQVAIDIGTPHAFIVGATFSVQQLLAVFKPEMRN